MHAELGGSKSGETTKSAARREGNIQHSDTTVNQQEYSLIHVFLSRTLLTLKLEKIKSSH